MRLGKVLKAYRDSQFLSVRNMALEIGIPSSTYHRIEVGRSGNEIDAETWIIVTNWLAGQA